MAPVVEPGSITVKLFGTKPSPAAYAILDFLQRSVVAFEWIELQSDEEARTLAQWRIGVIGCFPSASSRTVRAWNLRLLSA